MGNWRDPYRVIVQQLRSRCIKSQIGIGYWRPPEYFHNWRKRVKIFTLTQLSIFNKWINVNYSAALPTKNYIVHWNVHIPWTVRHPQKCRSSPRIGMKEKKLIKTSYKIDLWNYIYVTLVIAALDSVGTHTLT